LVKDDGGHETQRLGHEIILGRSRHNEETELGYIDLVVCRRGFVVREEFASYGFLAVACAGVCLLSAGLIALVLS
jgi:hypothetical protein